MVDIVQSVEQLYVAQYVPCSIQGILLYIYIFFFMLLSTICSLINVTNYMQNDIQMIVLYAYFQLTKTKKIVFGFFIFAISSII